MNSRLEKCCDVCGRSFMPKIMGGHAKRCSLECSRIANLAKKKSSYRQRTHKNKMCNWCGTEFMQLRRMAYCCDNCRTLGLDWYRKKYRAKNRDKMRQKKRQYYKKNRDKLIQKYQDYYKRNHDSIRMRRRQANQDRYADPSYRERLRCQKREWKKRRMLALHIARSLGLIEQRIVSSDKDERRYAAAYYKKHKDRYDAYWAAYRKKHKDKVQAFRAAYEDKFVLAKELCSNLDIQLNTKGETNDSSS